MSSSWLVEPEHKVFFEKAPEQFYHALATLDVRGRVGTLEDSMNAALNKLYEVEKL